MLDLTTDNLAMKRAQEIHDEGRASFDFGPPPYSTGLDVSHSPTGRTWQVRISDHIPLTGVDALLLLITGAAKADSPDVMAFGLAYIAAASEIGAVTVALEMGREAPNA